MEKKQLLWKAVVNIVIYIFSTVLVVFLLPKAIVFFLPFVIGWIISLIANPFVKFFEEKIKFKRKAMSAIMIVLIIAIIIAALYGIMALLISQGIGLAKSIPGIWDGWKVTLYRWSTYINDSLPGNVQEFFYNAGTKIEDAMSDFVSNLSKNITSDGDLINSISSGIGSIGSILIGVIMAVLSAYVFTAEHNRLVRKMELWFPETVYGKVMAAYRGLSKAVSGYFKAQFKIEVWVYAITLIGLLIIRVDYAVVIALLIAILDLLPFFGAGLIMIPWAAFSLFNGDYFVGIGMIITWGVGQLVRQLIQPKIVGDSVGLSPLPTLLSLFIGYKLLGVIGMVIAVPIAMIIVSLYEEGVFATLVDSLKIVWSSINRFRKLPERPWSNSDENRGE